MRKIVLAIAVMTLCLGMKGAVAEEVRHFKVNLVGVNGSGVKGHVSLVALPHGGTLITVDASGLKPGGAYVSLYYDNDVCDLEPYSDDDIVGTYIGNKAGLGVAVDKADDDLDEINSVSVRNAEDFSLLACATVR